MKATCTFAAIALMFVMVSGSRLAAQGAIQLSSPNQTINTSGLIAMQFGLTATNAVRIYRVGMQANAGVRNVDLWYRAGGMTTAIPGGWTLAGTVLNHTFVLGINQIPIDLNIVIQPSQSYGIAVVYHGGTSPFSYNTAPNPQQESDANLTLNLLGNRAGTYSATNNPSVTSWTAGNACTRTTVWYDLAGPGITLTTTPGTAQNVPTTEQGPGNAGLAIGRFTLASNTMPGTELTSIQVQASGTGNDATAYTEVAIYRDANATTQYDAGDVLVAPTIPAFPNDDGQLNFAVNALEQSFGVSDTRNYFVVAKLGGAPASHNQTFNSRISDVTVSGTATKNGTFATVMNGLVIVGPALSAVIASGAPFQTNTSDTGGGDGVLAGTFDIQASSLGACTLNAITMRAAGDGNDAAVYTQVALYQDTDTSGTWSVANDQFYGTPQTSYLLNDGQIVFTGAAPMMIPASGSRRFFVVVKFGAATPALDGQLLTHQVAALAVDAPGGVIGLPSANVSGVLIAGPRLTVGLNTPATRTTVLQTAAGDGVLGAWFTVAASSFGPTTLDSISVQAQGSGNDLTAYTDVRLYTDVNNNQTFEIATDTPYGEQYANFGSDNGTLVFTATRPFAASESVRYLVVVKFNGPTLPSNGQQFDFRVTAVGVGAGINTTVPATTMNGLQINGPVLTNITTATPQSVYADAQGPGNNGIVAATVVVSNTASSTGTLNSISIQPSGTGLDNTAFSHVGVYLDVNNNSTFDGPTTDTLATNAVTAFAGLDTAQVFTFITPQTFAASAQRRYFVVVRFNGTVLAAPGHTFNFAVSAMVAGNGTVATPTTTPATSVTILAPAFTVTDGGSPLVTAYRGLGDYVLQEFTMAYPAGPNNSLASITLRAGGTGNDLTAYDSVDLYHDSNASGDYEPGTDTLVQSQLAFGADNGTAQFNISGPVGTFVPANSRTFFVVAAFSNLPPHGATFQTRIESVVTGYGGTTFAPVLPGPFSQGAVVNLPPFLFTDNSAPAAANAFLGDSGFTLQKFTVEYAAGPANVLGSIDVAASGTGNDLTDYSGVHLYLDDPAGPSPGDFDLLDTLASSQVAFNADDGTLTFTLSGPAADFVATDLKQFFVVGDFNQLGVNATTFATAITGAAGMNFGGQAVGLPTAASAGLILLDANVRVVFNGPGITTSVNCDSQGINGEGLLLCDVSLRTGPGSRWSLEQLTFVGAGTADHSTAYSDLWLYQDDGNGIWDGPNFDSPAASPLVGFSAGTFEATFDLLNLATGLNATRRFFLFGRLAGTATQGQTLNARLNAVTATPEVGGSVSGAPTVNSTALIIDTTTLTVLSGPATAPDLLRKTGTALVYPILMLRMGATNDSVNVNGINFSTAGTGDFASSLTTGDGFQVWLDDGDGVLTAADSLVYQGNGAATVNAVFATPIAVPNASTRDLWVVLNVRDTAGDNAAVPVSYQVVVNSDTDIDVGGGANVLLGTPAPQSNVLRIVDFFVTNFDPAADLPGGGKDITITGSGFMAPIIVSIDGVVCGGTAVINAGTQVTGLTVPPGTGLDVGITIKSGGLDTETLAQTFDYVPLQTPKPSSDPGCMAAPAAGTGMMLVSVFAMFGALARRRRNR